MTCRSAGLIRLGTQRGLGGAPTENEFGALAVIKLLVAI